MPTRQSPIPDNMAPLPIRQSYRDWYQEPWQCNQVWNKQYTQANIATNQGLQNKADGVNQEMEADDTEGNMLCATARQGILAALRSVLSGPDLLPDPNMDTSEELHAVRSEVHYMGNGQGRGLQG